jgi:Reverse transcriptase (RNA-dependent DNA polymerase)/GAG-pre-integrase domain
MKVINHGDTSGDERIGALKAKTIDLQLWHRRLGHFNTDSVKQALKHGSSDDAHIKFTTNATNTICDTCAVNKSHKRSFSTYKHNRSERAFALVYTDIQDVSGKTKAKTHAGYRHIVLFIDDYTRYMWIRLLKHKSEALKALIWFNTDIVKAHGARLQCIQPDNAGEYTSEAFKEYRNNNAINYRYSAPYSPEQNGIAERAWRTITNATRCMLKGVSTVNSKYWGHAAVTAVYIKNRLPNKKHGGKLSSYEVLERKKPTISHIRTFGAIAYVHRHRDIHKLDDRAWKGILVGYDEHSTCYLVLNTTNMRVYKTVHVRFDEQVLSGIDSNVNNSTSSDEQIVLDICHDLNDTASSDEVCESADQNKNDDNGNNNSDTDSMTDEDDSNSISKNNDNYYYDDDDAPQPQLYNNMFTTNNHGNNSVNNDVNGNDTNHNNDNSDTSSSNGDGSNNDNSTNSNDNNNGEGIDNSDRGNPYNRYPTRMRTPNATLKDYYTGFYSYDTNKHNDIDDTPRTFKEAINSSEHEQWSDSIDKEFSKLNDNGTLEYADNSPTDAEVIGSKLVFKKKRDSNGNVISYKTRVVALGNHIKDGAHATDTYTSVLHATSLRTLLAAAVALKWHIHHIDFESAYLNADISEGPPIYLRPPTGILFGDQ